MAMALMPVNVLPPIIISLLLFVNTNAWPDRAFGNIGTRWLRNPIASGFLVLLIRDKILEDLPVYGLVPLVLLIEPPNIKEVEFNSLWTEKWKKKYFQNFSKDHEWNNACILLRTSSIKKSYNTIIPIFAGITCTLQGRNVTVFKDFIRHIDKAFVK